MIGGAYGQGGNDGQVRKRRGALRPSWNLKHKIEKKLLVGWGRVVWGWGGAGWGGGGVGWGWGRVGVGWGGGGVGWGWGRVGVGWGGVDCDDLPYLEVHEATGNDGRPRVSCLGFRV